MLCKSLTRQRLLNSLAALSCHSQRLNRWVEHYTWERFGCKILTRLEPFTTWLATWLELRDLWFTQLKSPTWESFWHFRYASQVHIYSRQSRICCSLPVDTSNSVQIKFTDIKRVYRFENRGGVNEFRSLNYSMRVLILLKMIYLRFGSNNNSK